MYEKVMKISALCNPISHSSCVYLLSTVEVVRWHCSFVWHHVQWQVTEQIKCSDCFLSWKRKKTQFFVFAIFTALLFLPFIVSSVFPGRSSSSSTSFSVTSLTSHLLLLPQSAPSPPFFSTALTHDSRRGWEVTGIIELWGTCMLR